MNEERHESDRDDETRAHFFREVRRRLRAAQARLGERMGVPPDGRTGIVADMLARHLEDRITYWFRLALSTGIATFGLALDSTGVVIGAMLISPLMDPIVGLGMGLATGSPYLTLRSSVRLGASLLFVPATAALLILMLPYHVMTREIAARTSPTLVDLSVASLCALAAGFTTVRRSSDTAAAAAGTAIGIALVPPLCVVGIGIGIFNAHVAGGATLLFTANLSAIVFFSVLLFVLLGFDAIDIQRLESLHVQATTGVAKVAALLRRAFGARYGPLLRFLMPALLVASVYSPLSTALGEVAWKVRVQADIDRAIAEVTPAGSAVRTAVSVESHKVAIRIVLVADEESARRIEQTLRERVAAAAGVVPTVEVIAVPDHAALESVPTIVAPEPVAAPPPVLAEPSAPTRPSLASTAERVDAALAERWPKEAGTRLGWRLESAVDGDRVLVVRHDGPPLGPAAEALLAAALGETLEEPLRVRARAVPLGRVPADPDDLAAWLPRLREALEIAAQEPDLHVCLSRGPHQRWLGASVGEDRPDVAPQMPVPDPAALSAERMLASTTLGERLRIVGGETWAVEVSLAPCPSPATSAEPSPPSTEPSPGATTDTLETARPDLGP